MCAEPLATCCASHLRRLAALGPPPSGWSAAQQLDKVRAREAPADWQVRVCNPDLFEHSTMADFVQQRINMVESQVRPSDVTDRRIIRAMLELPREDFVPEAMRAMAYMDGPLEVTPRHDGAGARYLLPPRTLAKLIQLAEIDPSALVLDLGPATGYSAALLAKLAARVVALEVDPALCAKMGATLRHLGLGNVKVIEGPLPIGAKAEGPFDAILLNGAVEAVDPDLVDQLKIGGKMVGVLATGPFGRACVWCRSSVGVDTRSEFDAAAPLMPGFARPAGFVF
jgi:protein-L-isoaspartate(D-aspartate) O-methyltransferase